MISSEQISRPGLVLGLLLLVGLSLSGCGRKSDGASDSDSFGNLAPPIESGAAEGQFGNRFEQIARADPNSEPMNVEDGDMPPVDPTAEPFDVP